MNKKIGWNEQNRTGKASIENTQKKASKKQRKLVSNLSRILFLEFLFGFSIRKLGVSSCICLCTLFGSFNFRTFTILSFFLRRFKYHVQPQSKCESFCIYSIRKKNVLWSSEQILNRIFNLMLFVLRIPPHSASYSSFSFYSHSCFNFFCFMLFRVFFFSIFVRCRVRAYISSRKVAVADYWIFFVTKFSSIIEWRRHTAECSPSTLCPLFRVLVVF